MHSLKKYHNFISNVQRPINPNYTALRMRIEHKIAIIKFLISNFTFCIRRLPPNEKLTWRTLIHVLFREIINRFLHDLVIFNKRQHTCDFLEDSTCSFRVVDRWNDALKTRQNEIKNSIRVWLFDELEEIVSSLKIVFSMKIVDKIGDRVKGSIRVLSSTAINHR